MKLIIDISEKRYQDIQRIAEVQLNRRTQTAEQIIASGILVEDNPQGEWIYDRTRDWDGECKYECSICGMGSDVDYPYCMRCGAKMGKEQK